MRQAFGTRYKVWFNTVHGKTYCTFRVCISGLSQVGKTKLAEAVNSIFDIHREVLDSTTQGIWDVVQRKDGNNVVLVKDEFGGVLRSYHPDNGRYNSDWFRNIQKLCDTSGFIAGRSLSTKKGKAKKAQNFDIEDACVSMLMICTPNDLEESSMRDLFTNGWWNRTLMVEDLTEPTFRPIMTHASLYLEDIAACKDHLAAFNTDYDEVGAGEGLEIHFPDDLDDTLNDWYASRDPTDGWWQHSRITLCKLAAVAAAMDYRDTVSDDDLEDAHRLIIEARKVFDKYYNVGNKEMNIILKFIQTNPGCSKSALAKHCANYSIDAIAREKWLKTLMDSEVIAEQKSAGAKGRPGTTYHEVN